MLIADGLPACFILDQATRRATWKGKKLTVQGSAFRPDPKHEEPATRALRELIEKNERIKREQRNAAQREDRLMKKRQKAKATKERAERVAKTGGKAMLKKPAPKVKPKAAEPQVVSRLKPNPKPATPLKRPLPARKARESNRADVPRVSKPDALKAFITAQPRTLEQICSEFGWLAHSARAAISQLNKNGEVVRDKAAKTYSLPAPKAA